MSIRGGVRLIGRLMIRPELLRDASGSSVVRRYVIIWLLGTSLVFGLATAAIQLVLLDQALETLSLVNPASHVPMMRAGFLRLIAVDRFLPPPTLIMAAVGLFGICTWSIQLSREKYRRLGWIILFGLLPVLLLRAGEFGLTLLGLWGTPSVGEVMVLPGRFTVGPRLFAGADPAPWVYGLDARLNLVTLWVALLWLRGVGDLVPRQDRMWAVVMTVVSLFFASLVTWSWGPPFLDLILRGW
jgi:hypothetical protein